MACIGITIAWFSSSDWGSSGLGMSGKVNILAVGKGDQYHSIEDTVENANLVINLSDNYNVFIPGMEIDAQANCKIFKSTTSPLLRAKFSVLLYDKNNNKVADYLDESNVKGMLEYELSEIVSGATGWYKYSDGYYYYVGEHTISAGDTLLQEINVKNNDVVVPFINKSFKFPTGIDGNYSGYKVSFKIEFQAIQDYIPDDNGNKLPNSISNSYKIFSNLEDSKFIPTSSEYFEIKMINGVNTISAKSGVTLPENVVLPSYDADGNPITHIAGTMKNIKSIVVPSTYTSMDDGVFSDSQLESADLSRSNITIIPTGAFMNSTKLSEVLLPSGLKELQYTAFKNASISSIVLPETLESLRGESLYLHKLTYLYIPKNVNYISSDSAIVSSEGMLQKIEVDDDNDYYKDDMGLALLTKDGKTLQYFVQGVELDEYHIPDGVTTVKSNTFSRMECLKKLYIPASIKTIGDMGYGYNFQNIYVDAGSTSFKSVEDNTLLLTYDGKRAIAYAKSNTRQKLTLPDTVTSFDRYAIHDATYMKNIVIGANLGIDENTLKCARFLGCDHLSTIEVSASNTKYYSANGCLIAKESAGDKLVAISTSTTTTIEIPSGVVSIISSTLTTRWYGNKFNIVFPSSVTNISYSNVSANMGYLEFKGTTPPTIDSGFNSDNCKIVVYVPDSAVNTYKAVSALSGCAILPVSQKS